MTTLIDDLVTAEDNTINLPHEFKPRDYQMPVMRAMVPELFPPEPSEYDLMMGMPPGTPDNVKNAVLVWHRRAGKDKCSINILICRAMIDVPGYYLYMAPEASQARKIIWQGIGSDGMKFIDHIPKGLIKTKRDQEMYIELINGSIIQVGGADNFDSLVGTNPKGIVFSEYSIQNPAALQYFRPMLVENGGWSLFVYTSRGHNHGHTLHKIAKERYEEGDKDWFHQIVTIDESKRADGTPVVTHQQFVDEVRNGMPEATALQEFYCDFDQGMPGAYYADLLSKLRKEGSVGHFPHDPKLQVITAWDLGLNDATAIWYIQVVNNMPRVIDYDEAANVPMTEWIRRVKDKPYNYFDHIGPHDLNQRDQMSGFTRLEQCKELGFYFTVAPKLSRADGIEASRALLPICQFHEETCSMGLEALTAYERVYDEKLKTFKDNPLHNWASHGADAWRYLAVVWDNYRDMNSVQRVHAVITSSGTRRIKGGAGAMPPLITGGRVRVNGK